MIFKLSIQNYTLGFYRQSALRWMSHKLIDEKSILVQVMAWCRKAASHYLNQCWPWFMSPYGVIRPQYERSKCRENSWNRFDHTEWRHTFNITDIKFKFKFNISKSAISTVPANDLTPPVAWTSAGTVMNDYRHCTVVLRTIAYISWNMCTVCPSLCVIVFLSWLILSIPFSIISLALG